MRQSTIRNYVQRSYGFIAGIGLSLFLSFFSSPPPSVVSTPFVVIVQNRAVDAKNWIFVHDTENRFLAVDCRIQTEGKVVYQSAEYENGRMLVFDNPAGGLEEYAIDNTDARFYGEGFQCR